MGISSDSPNWSSIALGFPSSAKMPKSEGKMPTVSGSRHLYMDHLFDSLYIRDMAALVSPYPFDPMYALYTYIYIYMNERTNECMNEGMNMYE